MAMGWSIALHGYQHLYETNDSGLLGLNKYEFSGLSYEMQIKKLKMQLKSLILTELNQICG